MLKATDATISDQHEYGPFGEAIRATGPTAQLNPFQFSTKHHDDETDLLYYGYRWYQRDTGRWLSKDPLFELALTTPLYFDSFASSQDESRLAARWDKFLNQEETWLTEAEFIIDGQMLSKTPALRAIVNLYAFARNSPLNFFDPTGLDDGAIAYEADELAGHAAIWINGKGYGFGPKKNHSNPLWTTGTTTGWEFTATPRTATKFVLTFNGRFGDGIDGSCSCATWARVGQCADYFEKTWDNTTYRFPSRTCRTYVHTIEASCCLKAKSQTHEQ
jgi:RHS repeat-associated protein